MNYDDDDDDLDRWIRRVVDVAGSDAPTWDGSAPARVRLVRRSNPRWPVAVAAAIVAVLGVGVLAVLRHDGDGHRIPTGPTSDAEVPTTDSTPSLTTAAPATTDAPTTSTSTSDTPAPSAIEARLTQPIIDLDGCAPTWAGGSGVDVIEGAYIFFHPGSVPMQLFSPPGGSVAGEFAVAMRIFTGQRVNPEGANVELNGLPAKASFRASRWGDLLWRLPDGSDAYLRTSTMTQDQLVSLAISLEPRADDVSIPGFDVGADFVLLDERVTPFTIEPIVTSACEFDDGGWLRAAIMDGPPLAQAVYLTDRPYDGRAVVRLLDDGRLLVVDGRADTFDRTAEALTSVRQGTDSEWTHLTAQDRTQFDPYQPFMPTTTPSD